ncbi:hypothetical protein Q604_UNBc4C00183G0002, partial [human gut metagenome]
MNNKKTKINLTLDCEVIRNLEIDDTNIDGETVMMDIENGEYYALNEVGTRVWELTKEKINTFFHIIYWPPAVNHFN